MPAWLAAHGRTTFADVRRQLRLAAVINKSAEVAAAVADGRLSAGAAEALLPLPMAGPKGAGLSLMAELITGLLTNDPILLEALSEKRARHRQNALVIAMDIASFTSLTAFQGGVQALAAVLGAMPRQPGFDAILMPGERGDQVHDGRAHDGIPIPRPVWADLTAVAGPLGVAMPIPSG